MPYDFQYDLRGKRIEDTYSQLTQYDTASGVSYTGQGLALALSAAYASSASYAISSSIIFINSYGVSSSFASSSISSSNSISSSYANTSSFSTKTVSSSFATNANTAYNLNYNNAAINVKTIGSGLSLSDGSGASMGINTEGFSIIEGSSPNIPFSLNNSSNQQIAAIDKSGSYITTGVISASAFYGTASYASFYPIQLPNITDNTIGQTVGILQTNPQYTLDINGNIGNSEFGNSDFIEMDDSHGNLILYSNPGQILLTSNVSASVITASLFYGTASYAVTASYASNGNSISSSYFSGSQITASAIDVSDIVSNPVGDLNLASANGKLVGLTTGSNINLNAGYGYYLPSSTKYSGSTIQIQGGDATIAGYRGNIILTPGSNVHGQGNVGINNPNPTSSLDVVGSINFTTNLLQNGLPYTSSNTNTSSYIRLFNGTTNSWYMLQVSGSVGQETLYIIPTT